MAFWSQWRYHDQIQITRSSYHKNQIWKCLWEWLPSIPQSHPLEHRHFTVLTGQTTLQICAVELQWKCIEKTVILKNYSSLLLTFVRCIFYKLKIVILALFSCSLFCIELNAHIASFHYFSEYKKKTVKIEKIAKIHSFVLYKFNLTT